MNTNENAVTSDAKALLNTISEKFKSTISRYKDEDFFQLIEKQYRKLNLLNNDSQWISKSLEELSEKLLPKEIKMTTIYSFIDTIVEIAQQNESFMLVLDKIAKEDFQVTQKKFDEMGNDVIPDVIAYAYILEKLTNECTNNHKVLEDLYHQFKRMRKELGSFKELPFFLKIKLISVELPIKAYLGYHKTGHIPPKSGGTSVAVNIMEAVFTDIKAGNFNNAKAGRILAKNKAGSLKKDERTGAGPSGWSKDGKMVERVYPFPSLWADLYQTWNMCFVTRFHDYPYVMAKLFIPQVAAYHDKPKNYIYNRAIALYIYLNFTSFDYVIRKINKEKMFDWRDKKLSKFFGSVNKTIAERYDHKVKNK